MASEGKGRGLSFHCRCPWRHKGPTLFPFSSPRRDWGPVPTTPSIPARVEGPGTGVAPNSPARLQFSAEGGPSEPRYPREPRSQCPRGPRHQGARAIRRPDSLPERGRLDELCRWVRVLAVGKIQTALFSP